MSRSEQLHDASMEEILASIRKIITDDEPDQPSEDAFSASAIDEFREASAALARNRPSGGYMHDLTRALAGEAPAVAAEDDIFDDDGSEPDAAMTAPLQREASAAPDSVPPADDEDLFEAEPEAAPVVGAAQVQAAGSEADEEIIEDLGDPIMLGPEIELVEEAPEASVAVAPVEPEVIVDAAAPELDVAAYIADEPAEPLRETMVSAAASEVPVVAAPPPPPPPPPVLSAIVEAVAATAAGVAAKAVADVAEPATEAVADVEANAAVDVPALAPSPSMEAAAEAVAETAVEAAVGSGMPEVEAVAAPAAEAVTEIAIASVAQTLEAKAAALVEEISAPVTGEIAAAEAPAPEPIEAAPVSPMAESAQPAQPAPSLVPDDMMAAMLKPMLKEWLDANMPRIVAKAMGGQDEAGAKDAVGSTTS